MKRKTTKKQALAYFMTHIYPLFVEQGRQHDSVALDYEWACYRDSLCKDGEITEWQDNNWATPNWPKVRNPYPEWRP